MSERAEAIARKVEAFIREAIVPYEKDSRATPHGPTDELVREMRGLARAAGVLTPHIFSNGTHCTNREIAIVFKKAGLSPLGPVALNVMAPDEGNMYLISKVGSADHKRRFLAPLVAGEARSAFFMTEPASD